MPRGYRSIILAVGLTLCGASPSPQDGAVPKKQQSAQAEPKATPYITAVATKASEPVEPPEYYQPCGQNGSQGKSDLCAQWSAANAAKEAANWAWYQMWLSLAGVLGLVVTLWYNFRALRLAERESEETTNALIIAERNASAAARASQSASEANRLAREAMQRQLRPYVYLDSISIKYDHMGAFDFIGDKGEIKLVLKNFGNSPARRGTIRARAFVGGVWNAPFNQGLDDTTIEYLADLPPQSGRTQSGYTVLGLKESHGSILLGNASVFIEGQIRYEDGFGNEYFTNFRLASTETDYLPGVFSACPDWNVAS